MGGGSGTICDAASCHSWGRRVTPVDSLRSQLFFELGECNRSLCFTELGHLQHRHDWLCGGGGERQEVRWLSTGPSLSQSKTKIHL